MTRLGWCSRDELLDAMDASRVMPDEVDDEIFTECVAAVERIYNHIKPPTYDLLVAFLATVLVTGIEIGLHLPRYAVQQEKTGLDC